MPDAPVLTDGVVTLRLHRDSDVPEMVAMGTDAETARGTSVPLAYGEATARRWGLDEVPAGWADGTAFGWAIEAVDAGTPRFAGNVDVRLGPPPAIGYALAPWARGHGLMARAVRLATRWAFDVGGLPIIHWSANTGNFASWRVAHAAGFRWDGPRPLSLDQRGELRDAWWAHLRADDPMEPATRWLEPVVLRGARVRLRPLAEADVGRIAEACSDERTNHWLRFADPYTRASAEEFLLASRVEQSLGVGVTWAVADPDTDLLLANVGLFHLQQRLNPTGAEIGYWAHPDARGRGAISEAVRLVLDHAFTPMPEGGLGRNRVQLGASWENTASRHVAEQAGFKLLGRHRQDGVLGDGTQDDGAWYELLATDPRPS